MLLLAQGVESGGGLLARRVGAARSGDRGAVGELRVRADEGELALGRRLLDGAPERGGQGVAVGEGALRPRRLDRKSVV